MYCVVQHYPKKKYLSTKKEKKLIKIIAFFDSFVFIKQPSDQLTIHPSISIHPSLLYILKVNSGFIAVK